jgi:hypothetical protein
MAEKDDFFKRWMIYFNEMDFVGQEKVAKYHKIVIGVTAVRRFVLFKLI